MIVRCVADVKWTCMCSVTLPAATRPLHFETPQLPLSTSGKAPSFATNPQRTQHPQFSNLANMVVLFPTLRGLLKLRLTPHLAREGCPLRLRRYPDLRLPRRRQALHRSHVGSPSPIHCAPAPRDVRFCLRELKLTAVPATTPRRSSRRIFARQSTSTSASASGLWIRAL